MAETRKSAGGAVGRVTRRGLAKVAKHSLDAVAKGLNNSRASAAALVAAQLPGWKLVPDRLAVDLEQETSDMRSEKGPSIAQLSAKFLGEADMADAADDSAATFADVDESTQTVQVQPRRGGPAKTADLKDGKISIVQG
jgi:hypothetical protein